MNAKKFLAACTAAVLTLGFSLGASSVAFADETVDEPIEITVDEQVEDASDIETPDNSERTPEVVSTLAPANHNANHVQGGPTLMVAPTR